MASRCRYFAKGELIAWAGPTWERPDRRTAKRDGYWLRHLVHQVEEERLIAVLADKQPELCGYLAEVVGVSAFEGMLCISAQKSYVAFERVQAIGARALNPHGATSSIGRDRRLIERVVTT
jgi:hypothetical protein